MNAHDSIRYLNRAEISNEKWNARIKEASNGRVYAYTDFLDAMADNWDALVLDDYKAVMPLPWRKKYGIYYLYQPFLTAQLGLFGNHLNEELFRQFLNSIPTKFRLWEIPFNQENIFSIPGYPIYQRVNFILPLQKTYEALKNNFRENVIRNIRKSAQYGCTEAKDVAIDDVLSLAMEQNGQSGEFHRFRSLFLQMQHRGLAKCVGIKDKDNVLIASCALLESNHRLYYLLVGNHPNGRTLGASHALINSIIRDHAESNLSLDFEGSDIRNLAFFYSGFGAKVEYYTAIKLNLLPWYLKWMKKSSLP